MNNLKGKFLKETVGVYAERSEQSKREVSKRNRRCLLK